MCNGTWMPIDALLPLPMMPIGALLMPIDAVFLVQEPEHAPQDASRGVQSQLSAYYNSLTRRQVMSPLCTFS